MSRATCHRCGSELRIQPNYERGTTYASHECITGPVYLPAETVNVCECGFERHKCPLCNGEAFEDFYECPHGHRIEKPSDCHRCHR